MSLAYVIIDVLTRRWRGIDRLLDHRGDCLGVVDEPFPGIQGGLGERRVAPGHGQFLQGGLAGQLLPAQLAADGRADRGELLGLGQYR